ncbi:MAG: hypothetical protein V9E98_08275 [Candidatus Nanopelagicales bacterium]
MAVNVNNNSIGALVMGLTFLAGAALAVLAVSLSDPPQMALNDPFESVTSQQRRQMLAEAWDSLDQAGKEQTCRRYESQTIATVLDLSGETKVNFDYLIRFMDQRCRSLGTEP